MTKRKATPKAKRKSRVGVALKPAAKATKTAGTKAKSPPKAGAEADAPAPVSHLSDQWIRELTGWRGETLAHMRALILEADPEMIEERKWRKPSNAMAGVPVWSHHGIVCTGETYTKVVKLTFARGASLPDPSRLFNSSLEGNTRRAIDIHEGEQVDAATQFQLGRQHAQGDRHPRRGAGRRGHVQDAHQGGGGPEWLPGEEKLDSEVSVLPNFHLKIPRIRPKATHPWRRSCTFNTSKLSRRMSKPLAPFTRKCTV